MAPKGGNRPNPKVEAALERKAAAEAEKKAKKAADAEAAEAKSWAVGSNARAATREQTTAEKHAEKMRKEAEKKAALEADEAANAGVPKPKKKNIKKGDDVSALLMAGLQGKTKVNKKNKDAEASTRAKEEAERRKAQQEALERSAKAKGVVMQDHRMGITENPNRPKEDEDAETATDIGTAITLLSGTKPGALAQSSKNIKALYTAFEAKTIPALKVDSPGLKQSQYKERCFALWQKSPENPKNFANSPTKPKNLE